MGSGVRQQSTNEWPANVLLPLLVLYLLLQVGVISVAAFQPNRVAPWVCVTTGSEPGQSSGPNQESDAGEPDSDEECLIPIDVNLGLGFTIAAFWLVSIVQVESGSWAGIANLAVGFSKFAAPAVAVYMAIWLGLQSVTLWFGLMIAFGFVIFFLIYYLAAAMGLLLVTINAGRWLIAKLRQPVESGAATVEKAVAMTTPLEAMEQLAGPNIAAYPEKVDAVVIWAAIEELYKILSGLADDAALTGIGYLWSVCGMLNVVYAHRDEPLATRLAAIWQANYCITAIVPVVSNDRNVKMSSEARQLVQNIHKGLNNLSATLYKLERPDWSSAGSGT